MKRIRTLSGPEESSIPIRSWWIKRPKKEEIYHSTDYLNLRSFGHQIESGSEGWTPKKKYKKAKRLLAIEEGDSWNHYRRGKNASEDWVALKDFLDRILGDRAHRVHTSLLDLVQAKKAPNELDDTFLRWFNTLKTKIVEESKNSAKIEVMLFFAELDESIQQKNHKQSSMSETKQDLVALAKKLRPNLDSEPKPSMSTSTCPTPFISTQLERSDALVASLLHKSSRKKEILSSCCKRKGHKESQCQKKSRDAKQREETRSSTAGAKISTWMSLV